MGGATLAKGKTPCQCVMGSALASPAAQLFQYGSLPSKTKALGSHPSPFLVEGRFPSRAQLAVSSKICNYVWPGQLLLSRSIEWGEGNCPGQHLLRSAGCISPKTLGSCPCWQVALSSGCALGHLPTAYLDCCANDVAVSKAQCYCATAAGMELFQPLHVDVWASYSNGIALIMGQKMDP